MQWVTVIYSEYVSKWNMSNFFAGIRKNGKVLAIAGGCTVLSLLLGWKGFIHALPGPHDSLRYLGMAETIAAGQWLGQYDHMTLIRLPLYPIFLAFNSLTGLPLHIVQQGIYLLGILLLFAALRVLEVSAWRACIAVGLCVFHPFAFWPATFVATEALYTPAATMVLAGCLGVLGTAMRSLLQYLFWVLVLSLSCSVLWYTRPEGVWILPLVVSVLGLLLWEYRVSLRRHFPRIIIGILFPCMSLLLTGYFIATLNEKYYGTRVTHELAEPNLVAAFRWLTRLAPESHQRYVPITRAAMDVAYQVSPHFAQLRPFLSKQTDGQGWAKFGCEWMGICDELVDGWTMWAIRDAVASIGMYSSAKTANQFYGKIAGEVQEACTEGRADCTRNFTGNILAPPITLEDVPNMAVSFFRMIFLTVSFGDMPANMKVEPQTHAQGGLAERYRRITHDQKPHMPLYAGAIRNFHFWVYKIVQVGGLFLILAGLVTRLSKRKDGKFLLGNFKKQNWIVVICSIIFLISRIGIISYIDAVSFSAQLRYLLVVYPPLLVLISLAIPKFRRESSA